MTATEIERDIARLFWVDESDLALGERNSHLATEERLVGDMTNARLRRRAARACAASAYAARCKRRALEARQNKLDARAAANREETK